MTLRIREFEQFKITLPLEWITSTLKMTKKKRKTNIASLFQRSKYQHDDGTEESREKESFLSSVTSIALLNLNRFGEAFYGPIKKKWLSFERLKASLADIIVEADWSQSSIVHVVSCLMLTIWNHFCNQVAIDPQIKISNGILLNGLNIKSYRSWPSTIINSTAINNT